MKPVAFITLVICSLFAACGSALPTRTVYLSPPPGVIYVAAIAIVKDMGFTITMEQKERRATNIAREATDLTPEATARSPSFQTSESPLTFKANKQDEVSGETIRLHLYFERKSAETMTHINIYQPHGNQANLEKIRDEIESRLRATVKK